MYFLSFIWVSVYFSDWFPLLFCLIDHLFVLHCFLIHLLIDWLIDWLPCWVFVVAQAFVSLWWVGATLWCGARISHCCGFSYCEAWALGHAGFRSRGVWAQQLWCTGSRALAHLSWYTGLVDPQPVKSSWSRDQTHVSYISRQIMLLLSH